MSSFHNVLIAILELSEELLDSLFFLRGERRGRRGRTRERRRRCTRDGRDGRPRIRRRGRSRAR